MKTHAELAEEISEQWEEKLPVFVPWHLRKSLVPLIIEALDAAYKRGAEEMRERAAKVIEEKWAPAYAPDLDMFVFGSEAPVEARMARHLCSKIPADIRALPTVEEK